MEKVVILTEKEYEGLKTKIDKLTDIISLQNRMIVEQNEEIEALNRKAAVLENTISDFRYYASLAWKRYAKLCEEHIIIVDKSDDIAWAERVGKEYEKKVWTRKIRKTCKKYHCEPEDVKYVDWHPIIESKPNQVPFRNCFISATSLSECQEYPYGFIDPIGYFDKLGVPICVCKDQPSRVSKKIVYDIVLSRFGIKGVLASYKDEHEANSQLANYKQKYKGDGKLSIEKRKIY